MTHTPLTPARVRTHTLTAFKEQGRKITMLTSYDSFTARIFQDAGIDVLLVGDSVGTTVLGYDSTVFTRHEDVVLFTGAVARATTRPLILADMAFGTYQSGPRDAVLHGVELIRAGAHAVKLEGGREILPQVKALVEAGIPVCGHLGFTPQSVHQLGGHKVQGRDHVLADHMADDALALQEAGAFAIVLEMVPAQLADRITQVATVPTIGIGAGVHCDGQVLVWQDMAGLSDFEGKFVQRFANLRDDLGRAASDYRSAVEAASFPRAEHSFE